MSIRWFWGSDKGLLTWLLLSPSLSVPVRGVTESTPLWRYQRVQSTYQLLSAPCSRMKAKSRSVTTDATWPMGSAVTWPAVQGPRRKRSYGNPLISLFSVSLLFPLNRSAFVPSVSWWQQTLVSSFPSWPHWGLDHLLSSIETKKFTWNLNNLIQLDLNGVHCCRFYCK